jgi:hypothetical protein
MIPALASVDELIPRVNGIDAGDLRGVLYSSLVSATIQLQGIARIGKLVQEVGKSEDFQIDRDTANRVYEVERWFKFRLSNSFVDQTTNPIELRYGINAEDLDSADPVPAQFLKYNLERGTVWFDSFGFNSDITQPAISRRIPVNFFRYMFRITYDYGLATKGSKDGRLFTGVPDWLVESTLIKAREIYQLTNPSQDNKAIDNGGNLSYLLDSNMRVAPLHLDPLPSP